LPQGKNLEEYAVLCGAIESSVKEILADLLAGTA
jgi:hypothetical protein